MPRANPPTDTSGVRQGALSRWENEGGAMMLAAYEPARDIPERTNAELGPLRVPIIAFENQ